MGKTALPVLVLLFFAILPLFAFPPLAVCADAGIAQDVLVSKTSFQFTTDARVSVSQEFQLRLPVNITFTRKGSWMADAGIMLTAYPFRGYGFFAGMTIVQFGYLKKNFVALNEITAGWTFNLMENLIVEPSVSLRDPSSAFSDEYATARGLFPCYTQIRIHLMVGWRIIKEEV